MLSIIVPNHKSYLNVFPVFYPQAKTFSDLYSDIDLTSYDEDLFEAEVNETTEEDWGTQQDPRYLIEEVFRNSYLNINRSVMLLLKLKVKDPQTILSSC